MKAKGKGKEAKLNARLKDRSLKQFLKRYVDHLNETTSERHTQGSVIADLLRKLRESVEGAMQPKILPRTSSLPISLQ